MSNETSPSRGHALVIGGSMAGLLAARVLADHFERVTVVERDSFPEGIGFRKGVPQSRHVHVLMTRGRRIVERFFPGFEASLLGAGAELIDSAEDFEFLTPEGFAPATTQGYRSSSAAASSWSTPSASAWSPFPKSASCRIRT